MCDTNMTEAMYVACMHMSEAKEWTTALTAMVAFITMAVFFYFIIKDG